MRFLLLMVDRVCVRHRGSYCLLLLAKGRVGASGHSANSSNEGFDFQKRLFSTKVNLQTGNRIHLHCYGQKHLALLLVFLTELQCGNLNLVGM